MADRDRKKEKELYFNIPRNVITRFELFPGIGWLQMGFGLFGFLLGAGTWIGTGFSPIPIPIRIFCSVLVLGVVVFISIPNPVLGNISLLDRIIKTYRFSKSQKSYYFRKGAK